jgi:enoyl-CoA hydratase/carnithine racemase
MDYEHLIVELGDDHVARVTLNRPDVLNSFNYPMCQDFGRLWEWVRLDDAVHVVVLRAAGERAFSSGMDIDDGLPPAWLPDNVWSQVDPSALLGPKSNRVWKPLICAVQGIAAGGAFYWFNEADIIICSEDATFFDPHVSYGIVAAVEPIGMTRRLHLGDVLRMALMGLDERVSATSARAMGLVSEVVKSDELWTKADELARAIAAKPPAAVQGSVRAIWESLELGRSAAVERALSYTQIGNRTGLAQAQENPVERPPWRLR